MGPGQKLGKTRPNLRTIEQGKKVEKGVFPAKSTVLLVGGGMGIAPLVYLADSLVDMGCQVEVFYGAETCGELVAMANTSLYITLTLLTLLTILTILTLLTLQSWQK